MGLDMYLSKVTYLSQYPKDRPVPTVSGQGLEHVKPERVAEISERVGYWRKANAIHGWFVENVQKGRDECQRTDVGEQDLRALLDACSAVIADPSRAADLLPATSGFFFGSTAYDEYYMQNLRDTVEIITPLLEEPCPGWYEYHASW